MKQMMMVTPRGFDAKISKWGASYISRVIPSKLVVVPLAAVFNVLRLTKLLRAQASLLNVIPSEADDQVPFERRARGGGSGSGIMLLIITRSNCSFYPGLPAKLIKTGQQCRLIVTSWHQKGAQILLCQTLCECHSCFLLLLLLRFLNNVAAVMPAGDWELPLGICWVLQSVHL